MIAKGLNFIFEYDGTTQGNIDRDAFKAVCDAELENDYSISVVNNARSSNVSLIDNTVKGEIYYSLTNDGLASTTTFYSTCQTEKAKSTVSFAYFVQYTLAANKETSNLVAEVKNPVS